MQIMRKLLDNLGNVWNVLPKQVPFLQINQHNGQHHLITIEEGCMFLHSAPFRRDMPVKQTVILKDMTFLEVIGTLTAMGYEAELTPEAHEMGVNPQAPLTLLEVENEPMDKPLAVFTSRLWKTMYPIYRVLRNAEFNTDIALKQLQRDMASGAWLDYWASFFSIQRLAGEGDNDFIRRFTMWLFNPKTNNIAIKELLVYQLKDNNIDVRDVAPNQFELLVGTRYLADATALHRILSEAKAAGVEYFLNYISEPFTEDYRLHLADSTGRPFENNDDLALRALMRFSEALSTPSEAVHTSIIYRYLETYTAFLQDNQSNIDTCSTCNETEILDPQESGLFEPSPNGVQDVLTATLIQGGNVVGKVIL